MPLRPLIIAAAIVLLSSPSSADDVSWTPPSEYTARLKPHLTPVGPVWKEPASAAEKDADGVVLVDEELQLLLPDARRLHVEHFAVLAVTESGAESIGRAVRSYQKTRQRRHVVLAQTIQPDGRKQPVNRTGVFEQTPQREADAALYDDSAETVLIFPNVKPGCVVEFVIVTEELKSRIPGEYTAFIDLAGGWPVRRLVRWAEMPDALAARMRFTPLGSGVPEMERRASDGRTTISWSRRNVPGLHPEQGRAPLPQTGPGVHLTTLPDWNAFLRWYAPLAASRAVADDKLKSLADEWTKDAKSPREVVEALARRVTDDVRYVGLEFDECDLEPHRAKEVWEHQYGDCKDKASLLVALLRHKGIAAHMGLVNTIHAGRVERRSPDFRHFNHAIAVALLEDGPLFIDATISGAPAGMLSPADGDRDVLLVREGEQWLQTPVQRAGRYGLDFEAAMAADGSLSGWVTLRADGYIGSLYADYERTAPREQVRQRLSRQAAARWQGARVVDLKPAGRSEPGGTYELSGYFTVPAGGAPSLTFPLPVGSLPDPGDPKERETDFIVWLEDLLMTSTISLPDGYSAELPAPLTFDGPFASGRAAWEKDGKGLRAVFEYRPKVERIAAPDAAAYAAMLAPLRTWLSRPLAIVVDEKARAAMPAQAEATLADLPVMPTGEGQLNLINERYPDGGNADLRRKALEKAMTLFPEDRALQFKAAVQLASLDIDAGKHEAALGRLMTPLESGKGAVDGEEVGLAEFFLALALDGAGRADEAMALLKRMSVQDSLSAWRRSYAFHQMGWMLREKDPAKALAALAEGVKLAAGSEADLLLTTARVQIGRGKAAELEAYLKSWLDGEPQNAAAVMTHLARHALQVQKARPQEAATLAAVLDRAGKGREFGREYADAIARAAAQSRAAESMASIRKELAAYLKASPGVLPKVTVPDDLTDEAAFVAAMNKVVESDKTGDASLRWHLEHLRRFPDSERGALMLRLCAAFENFRETRAGLKVAGPFLTKLLALALRLPESDRQWSEVVFLKAKVLDRCGKPKEAAAQLRQLAAAAGLGPDVVVTAAVLGADYAIRAGEPEAALKAWELFRNPEYAHYHAAGDACYRAALLEGERGNREAMWEWTDRLRGLDEDVLKNGNLAEPVKRWLAFTRDRAAVDAWWTGTEAWAAAWRKVARKLGLSDDTPRQPPVVASLEDFFKEIVGGVRAGNDAEVAVRLDLVARALRFDPVFAGEFVTLGDIKREFGLDGAAKEFDAAVPALLNAAAQAPLAEHRKLLALKVVKAFGATDWEALNAAVSAFRELPREEDAAAELLTRFWALGAAAQRKECEDAIAEMERMIERNALPEDHFRNAWVLSELLKVSGRPADAAKLLRAELERDEVKNNEAALALLRPALKSLENADNTAAGQGRVLTAWKAVHEPAWLASAAPADLAALGEGVEAALFPDDEALHWQSMKVATLVLADPAQPAVMKRKAVNALAFLTAEFAPDEDTAIRWLEALTNTEGAGDELRSAVLSVAVAGALEVEAIPFVKRIGEHQAWASAVKSEGMKVLEPVFAAAALAPGDDDGALAAAKQVLARPVHRSGLQTLVRLAARITAAGRAEDARRLAEEASRAAPAPGSGIDPDALRLTLQRVVKASEDQMPAQQALKAWWLKRQPQPVGAPPKVMVRDRAPSLAGADALAWFDARVRDGSHATLGLKFWFDFASDRTGVAAEVARDAMAVVKIAVAESRADADQSMTVFLGSSCVDMDDPAVRKEFLEALAPLRKLSGAPTTQDALRVLDLVTAMRTGQGEPADWLTALRGIKTGGGLRISRRRLLQAMVNRGDPDALKELLGRVPASALLDGLMLPVTIEAWRAAGMKEEEAVGVAKAKELLPGMISEAWATEDYGLGLTVLRLARMLGAPDLVPQAFTRGIEAALRFELSILTWRIAVADLRSDWPALLAAAEAGVALRPTDYSWRMALGKALVKSGRRAEAVEHLKACIQFAPDSEEWLEAQALLKEAEVAP